MDVSDADVSAAGAASACVQCGHPHPSLIRRPLRPVRYSCRSCGAVFRPGPPPVPNTAQDRLAPPGRNTAQDRLPPPGRDGGRGPLAANPDPVSAAAADGPRPGDIGRDPERPDADGDPLAAFMPVRMVRWVRAQAGPEPVPDAPDRATLARWYKDFDALVAAARSSPEARAAVERVSDVPLDRLPVKPPAFSKVCAALHATCYDAGLAASRLAGADPAVVAERIGHLRRWLATAGRSTTWLEAAPAPDPEPSAVEELLTPPRSFTADQVRALFGALFGVDKGPSVPGVRERFGDEGVREALLAYLKTGERPLREIVAADLAADPDPAFDRRPGPGGRLDAS
ncbi:hypothetical protein [Nonomuraea roseoviolacea]|uniref:GATA-type domain-containing protein n=1 Tax=Nonomuraea roseoviolacea subsp. carminata TaxID=160689 RepID=A0ABT1JRT2_9ACTN|nr:hypothetical protein [Nonomuraea roseoviolacea]MCP2344142.1 hypothetical protein [Nonomuraea roseoviolacea subsp. carminata]